MTDIHIVASFVEATEEDWSAIDLYHSLRSKNNVRLWSPYKPHPGLCDKYPINEIKPYQNNMPASGTLYVAGTSIEIGHWYKHVKFEKVVLIHNLFAADALYQALHHLTLNGTRDVEIQYTSKLLKDTVALPGEVIYPFPHLERFNVLEKPITQDSFVVGRVGADAMAKHHYGDPDLYRKLNAKDMQVKVIGGTCLKPWLQDAQGIELLSEVPHASMPAALATMDCFYYRTAIGIKEAFGLVVIEAMLCGLPVVCSRQGGYAEVIQHGKNGFLFDNEEEAFEIICELRDNPYLRQSIGLNAKMITTHQLR